MKIRSHLLLFGALSLLPVLAFSAVMTVVFRRQEREVQEDRFLERVRALSITLDREHTGMIQVLRAVGSSAPLRHGDLATFYEEAREVLRDQPSFASLLLADENGHVLFDLRRPLGERVPDIGSAAFLKALRIRGEPTVSSLQREPSTGEFCTYVGVPVVNGRSRGLLVAVVRGSVWLAFLGSYPIAPNATMTLLDQDHYIIARTLNNDRWVGKQPALAVVSRALQQAEDTYQSVGLEGQQFYSAHSRTRVSGWTVGTGVPKESVESALVAPTIASFLGTLIALGLAVACALLIGRRIAGAVAALEEHAEALGRGLIDLPPPPPPGIHEMDRVAAALQQAGRTIDLREKELANLLVREQAARAEAEAASRAKDEFLAMLSHELRTPLNAVYGWAHMLKEEPLDEATRGRALDVIVRNANAQVQLIDELLDVSRIVTGKMRLDVGQVDLKAVAEAALESVKPAADAKGIRVLSVLDPKAGPIMGDPNRLQQVVWNLLMNSVKFTPRNGRIQLHLQRIDSRAEIVVSDTGQGIDPAMLAHVFERFRQEDSSSTRAHGGLGLGLALVRHIVELHGGQAKAESGGAGTGATFTVSLPLALAEVADKNPARRHPTGHPPEPGLPSGTLAAVRVLVVDDDRDARELAAWILQGAGAQVRTTSSAPEALRVFDEWRPAVLLCDIEMPEEDGYSFIRRIRALDAASGGQTPAVALTAYGRVEDRVRSLSAGFSMHLPKPVDPRELVTVVASLA